ncbi:MAG: hypothetical protein H6713_21590 [Myxococcales bacterium]|nr:hypothetical protein [Myxococcales bacterium]MCB9752557.1 hypothetical protein [Myxococcales bacterium]
MSITDDVRKKFQDSLTDAKRLRDEIKLKINLGGMEARKRWQEYEPQLRKIEHEIEQIGEGAYSRAGEMLNETRTAFQKLLGDLKAGGKQPGEAPAEGADAGEGAADEGAGESASDEKRDA